MERPGLYARMFRRHAHPISAWSRLLSTPLLLVPLWTRRWRWYWPIGAWFAVNPVLAPAVTDETPFATRAMLGEEAWSRDPASEPQVLAVTSAAGAALLGAMVAAYHQRGWAAATGTGAFLVLTLLEWTMLADRFDRSVGSVDRPHPARAFSRRQLGSQPA